MSFAPLAGSGCRRSANGLRADTSVHWLEQLAGIPVTPVQDLATAGAHPRRAQTARCRQEVDSVDTVASPLQVDEERLEHRLPAPRLGAHWFEVLRDLDRDVEDLGALVQRGIVGSPA